MLLHMIIVALVSKSCGVGLSENLKSTSRRLYRELLMELIMKYRCIEAEPIIATLSNLICKPIVNG